jgi:hypothetical protein
MWLGISLCSISLRSMVIDQNLFFEPSSFRTTLMSMDNRPGNLQGLIKFMFTAQHFLRSKKGIATNQLVGTNNKNDLNNNDQ